MFQSSRGARRRIWAHDIQRGGHNGNARVALAPLPQAHDKAHRQGYEPQNGKQADLHESISVVGETVSYGPIQSGSKKLASV
jgi:hypothetical protein